MTHASSGSGGRASSAFASGRRGRACPRPNHMMQSLTERIRAGLILALQRCKQGKTTQASESHPGRPARRFPGHRRVRNSLRIRCSRLPNLAIADQGGSAALRRGALRAALWLEAPLARARQLDAPSRLTKVAHPRFRIIRRRPEPVESATRRLRRWPAATPDRTRPRVAGCRQLSGMGTFRYGIMAAWLSTRAGRTQSTDTSKTRATP